MWNNFVARVFSAVIFKTGGSSGENSSPRVFPVFPWPVHGVIGTFLGQRLG